MIIFILMVVMQFKHFIADYPLQVPYMLGKFKDKDWVLPLASHCAVHLVFTFLISYFVTYNVVFSLSLGFLDFIIHFIMDRIKASPDLLGRYQALSKKEMIQTFKDETTYNKELQNEKWSFNEKSRFRSELDEINNKRKSNVLFWWSLGLDQMVHHLTDILIVFLISLYLVYIGGF